jgi:predicted component of type VI protein secretion system
MIEAIKKAWQKFYPASAGKGASMSDANNTPNPAGASAGEQQQPLTIEQANKLVADAVAAATTPLNEQIAALQAENQAKATQVETLQAEAKALTDKLATAGTADPAAIETKAKELLAAQQAAAAEAQAVAEKREALRKKVIEANGLAGVDAALINLPETDDEAALTAAAAKIRKALEGAKVALPNIGGAGDGGTPPGKEAKPAFSGVLPPGLATFAS